MKIRIIINAVIIIFLLFYSTAFAQNTTLKVELVGVNEEVQQNILSGLDVSAMRFKSPEEVRQYFNSAPETIKKSLEPFGYFKSTIRSSLSRQPEAWIAIFNISPGPAMRVNALDFNITGVGVKDPAFQEVIAHFPLASGQIFSVPKYNEATKLLLTTALARGYFDAQFTQKQIKIDLQRYTASITLHFDTGRRYRFGQISFHTKAEKNPFDIGFLKRFSPFTPNEPYTVKKVEKFQEALSGSSYFKEVMVTPEVEQKKYGVVPINVLLTPLPAKQYDFALGYGTDTGIRGSAGVEWRHVTPTGQRFQAAVQASEINSNLQMHYIIPGKKPATDQFILTAAIEEEDETLGKSQWQKIMASYVTQLGNWKQTAALTLQNEHYSLEGAPYQTQLLLFPSIAWETLKQDNVQYPSRGYRINLKLLGAPDLFAETPFFQTQLYLKAIYPVFDTNRLVLRGNFDYTKTQNIRDLPLSLQFFAGGTDSIRGYSYNSIGPGSNRWIASVEYRQHITGHWYLAAFMDAGDVSNTLFSSPKTGIGMGAVWQTQLGTLELTLTQAQDTPGKPLLLQFDMGLDL